MQPALDRYHSIPRLDLGFYPTPIEEMPRLRAALGGGPRLWIKRDDYSGPGFGGNKIRKLEYVFAQARADGADTVITTGGEASNHCRVTAAVAARLGLRCILIMNPARSPRPASLYLDELYGAEIRRVTTRGERAQALEMLAEELRRQGRKVCVIPLGASMPLGSLGYVQAVEELHAQLQKLGDPPRRIYHSTSSGGTQAGLDAGLQLFGMKEIRLIGVSADDTAESLSRTVSGIVAGVAMLLGMPVNALRRPLEVEDGFAGEGYAIPTAESEEALQLVARTEGIVLDPVYTAKAMAALIAAVRARRIPREDPVLFWHTGGQMGLFEHAG